MVTTDEKTLRFVHIPKTAGVSILEGLKKSINASKTKWNIRGGLGTFHEKSSIVNRQKQRKNNDLSFLFIRNPWDRFVSSYMYLKNRNDDEYIKYVEPFGSFKDFAIYGPIDSLHFKPQTYWFDSPVDFVGRFEKLQFHFDGLCKKLSLTSDILKNSNTTEHKHYSEYYDDESKNAVAEKYKEDIDCLGYSFKEYKHPTYSHVKKNIL